MDVVKCNLHLFCSQVREPIARCYSDYYFFEVNRNGLTDRPQTRANYLKT